MKQLVSKILLDVCENYVILNCPDEAFDVVRNIHTWQVRKIKTNRFSLILQLVHLLGTRSKQTCWTEKLHQQEISRIGCIEFHSHSFQFQFIFKTVSIKVVFYMPFSLFFFFK